MKMIMLGFNEAIDAELMEMMQACQLHNYTRFNGILGKGEASGPHLGTDIWPGRNNLLLLAAAAEHVPPVISRVQALRAKMGAEGVKAFVWNLEEIT